jgi:PB1 domain
VTDGHYLNLPVMNDAGEIVGMVDVLKLTYATLEQINSMSTDGEGPAWNKFWLSLDHETESVMSGEGSHSQRPHTPARAVHSPDISSKPGLERGDSVMPHESASHHGDEPLSAGVEASPEAVADAPFAFKFKAPSGRVHRLQVLGSAGIAELVAAVAAKLGTEIDTVGGPATVGDGKLGPSGFAMSYVDNEGDTVSITTDQDLLEAIMLARRGRNDKVDLFVHDPSQPPLTATLDPRPGLPRLPTPPESEIRERKRTVESDEDDVALSKRPGAAQQEQLIAGVPNDMLLPGAIVTLAVVIVGVFTISRATSR